MTDRYDGFTVVLDKDKRSGDVQQIIDAIKLIKGVADVVPIVSTMEGWAAARSAKIRLLCSLQDWLKGELTG